MLFIFLERIEVTPTRFHGVEKVVWHLISYICRGLSACLFARSLAMDPRQARKHAVNIWRVLPRGSGGS